jgi:trigger factor
MISTCRLRWSKPSSNRSGRSFEQEAANEEDPEAALKEIEAERTITAISPCAASASACCCPKSARPMAGSKSAQEMQMLVTQAAQQYRPEDRQRFVQYLQETPMAAAQLRAPLFEDKVVDFLFDKASVTEKTVSRADLEAAIEAEPEAKPAKKAPAKKTAAKKEAAPAKEEKPAAKKAAPKKEAAKDEGEKPAKKAPAKKAAAKK